MMCVLPLRYEVRVFTLVDFGVICVDLLNCGGGETGICETLLLATCTDDTIKRGNSVLV